MCSLFNSHENDEWCRFLVHIGSPLLVSFYCVCLVSFYFFFLFFLAFFQRVNFQGINLVVLNFELPSTFLYALCELFEKQAVLCGNNSVLVKIRDSLLCATNSCIKFTSKLILPSVSRLKFYPPYGQSKTNLYLV